MTDRRAEDDYVPDPLTGAAVAGGVLLGLVASIVVTFILSAVLSDGGAGFWLVFMLPPLVGVVVLLVPRWRRAGAGFVLGLALGGIVFAGVCAGFAAWLNASLGG